MERQPRQARHQGLLQEIAAVFLFLGSPQVFVDSAEGFFVSVCGDVGVEHCGGIAGAAD